MRASVNNLESWTTLTVVMIKTINVLFSLKYIKNIVSLTCTCINRSDKTKAFELILVYYKKQTRHVYK